MPQVRKHPVPGRGRAREIRREGNTAAPGTHIAPGIHRSQPVQAAGDRQGQGSKDAQPSQFERDSIHQEAQAMDPCQGDHAARGNGGIGTGGGSEGGGGVRAEIRSREIERLSNRRTGQGTAGKEPSRTEGNGRCSGQRLSYEAENAVLSLGSGLQGVQREPGPSGGEGDAGRPEILVIFPLTRIAEMIPLFIGTKTALDDLPISASHP